jgi:hypothetical protein
MTFEAMTRFVLATLIALYSTKPADACDGCKPPTESELIASAVRVYAGKVLSFDKTSVRLEVTAVWKGTVSKPQVLATRCSMTHKIGRSLIVMDDDGKPGKFVDPCLGVQRDDANARTRIDKLAGAPYKPS